jgi:hypothetical protein
MILFDNKTLRSFTRRDAMFASLSVFSCTVSSFGFLHNAEKETQTLCLYE